MAITVNAPGWTVQGTSRETAPAVAAAVLPGLPDEFLTAGSTVEEEVVLQPSAATRDAGAAPATAIDLSCRPGRR